jgi:hypothetical protein
MPLLASVSKKRMLAAFFAGLLSSEESSLSVAQLAEALARNNEWIDDIIIRLPKYLKWK